MKAIYTIQNFAKRLAMMLAVGMMVVNAWGADPTETFTYSTYAGEGTQTSGSSYTMTGTNLSINDDKFYCGDYASYAQSYAGAKLTFTPGTGITIKQVVITAYSTSYNGYQSSGSYNKSTGTVSGSSGSTTITWTGTATSSFWISHTKQLRWTSIVVTYTAPTSISASPSSITFDDNTVDVGEDSETTTITLSNGTKKAGYYLYGWFEDVSDADHCDFYVNSDYTYGYTSGTGTQNLTPTLTLSYLADAAGTYTANFIIQGYNSSSVAVNCTIPLSVTIRAACSASPTVGNAANNGALVYSTTPMTVPVTCPSIGAGSSCSIKDYGFVWKASSAPTISDNKTQIGTDNHSTAFSGNISGTFAAGTTYYVKAYAINNGDNTTLSSSAYSFTPRSITFNSNGGSSVATMLVLNGTAASAPTAPTKTGYTFANWCTDSGLGTAVNWSSTITANKIYYAKWTAKQCTVTFDKESGTGGDNSATATYDAAMPTITPPTRDGYIFGGYWDGDNGTGNQYYKADGTSNANWNKNTTSNTTLYAKWTEKALTNYHTRCLTVTYAAGEGSGSAPSSHTMVNPNSKIELEDNTFIAPTGKAFDGWNDGSSTYDEGYEYTVTASKTMTAQWEFIDYNVTYSAPSNGNYTIKVADGSASSVTKTAHYGQTITLAATPTTGYHFSSWTIKKTSDNSDVTSSVSLSSSTNKDATFTMPDYGVTVTATFAIDQHTVTVVASPAGYGSVSASSITSVPYGTAVSTDGSTLTVTGKTPVTATPAATTEEYTYAFDNWSDVPATVTSNVTITANFTRTENVASVTVGGATTYYTTIAAAWTFVNEQTSDMTVKILKDITDIGSSLVYTPAAAVKCTLDLNNHLVKGTVSTKLLDINKTGCTFIITDNSGTKGGELYNENSGEATYYGVYVTAGTLKLQAGKVHAKNTKNDYASATTAAKKCMARGVGVASSQTFQMSGGEVEGESIYAGYGVETAGTTTISGGTIHGKTSLFTTARGIISTGSTTITGGTIKATAYTTTAQGIYVNGSTTSINSGDSVIIESKTTTSSTAYGVYVNSGTFNANTGCKLRVSVEAKTSTTYGVYVVGARTANIYAGKFNVKSTTGTAYGIYSSGTTTVHGGTFNVSTGSSTKAYGIYTDRGTVTLNNSPEFTVRAGSTTAYGVYATGLIPAKGATSRSTKTFDSSVTINGGTFTVSTGSGANAYGAAATRVSKIVLTTTNDSIPGNYARKGSIVINDGTFDVTSATTASYGIWCNSAVTANKYTGDGDNAGSVTATPTLTVSGGKFKVTSTSDANATAYAMNKDAANTNLVVEGGYYSTEKTNASSNPTIGGKYTAPKKSCNYRVFPISPALESKYNYKVAQFYTITYNKGSNGTGTVDPGYKAIGDDITITSSTFTRTGYTQTAWNTNSAGTGGTNYAFGATYSTDADLTLYPTWTTNTYTVTFDKEGGSGGSSSVTATYNAAMPSITAPTKTGYTFGGYWDGDGGTGTKYYNANGTSARTWNKASNTTLYAKWTANTITITWNANGEGASVTPTSSSYTYDGSTVTLPTPTRPLSVFTGWYTEESGGTEITEVGTTNKPTEDVTYYAHWRVLAFEVKDQAGTGTADIHLTSTRGVTVYATSGCGNLITIKADNLDAISNLGGGTANKQNIQIKYLDANNGDAEVAKASSPFRLCNNGSSNYNNADGNNINLNGLTNYSQTYSISYTPTAYGVIDHYKLQLRLQNNNTEAITIQFDLYGRSLPDEFVIAAKYADDNKWYALPNDLATSSSTSAPTPIEISVDNTTTPTKAMNVPSTLLYKACDRFQNSPNTQFASIRFTSNGTNHLQASTGGSDYQLWLTPSDNAVKQNWYLKSSNFGSYLVQMDPAQGSSKMIGFYNASGIKMGFHGTAPKGCDIYFLPVEYTDMSAEIMEWGTDHVVVDLRSAGSATKVKTQVGTGALSSAQTLASIKKDEGVYRVAVTLSESDAAKNLKLLFYNDSEVMQGGAKNTIPLLISDDDATTGSLSLSKDDAATCDLVVLDGGVLTVSETTDGAKYTFQDLYVYGGGKMVVPSGRYISFSNVYLRGGHLNSSWEYQYSNPQLVLNGTMGNSSNTINYDYLTNNAQFYSLALPYQVQLANIVNPYFNNKQSWEIHAYDGTKRASGSQVDGWYDVEVGSTGANTGNIAALTSSSYLTPGVGYTFWGAMQKVNSIRQKWSINRFPMTLASGSAEAAKAGVSVVAYGMTDGRPNDGVAVNDAGWNMLGNPYLANIGGTESFESSLSALIVGYHNEKELDGSGNWTGAWKEVEDAANVRYVRIPHDNGMDYDQVRVKDATFKSFRHFFIQAATSGTFTFSLSQRAQEAPARVQNNGATLPDEMDIDFILSNGEEQATFGLTVNDKLNTGFVVGEDMPEELGGTSSKAYTIAAENKLAYNGLPSTAAEQYIPVGYRAEAAGTYTFAYKPDEYTTYIEHIRLIDYATGDVTDLLDDTYEFSTEQGIFDERFALNVEFGRRNIPTGMEGTGTNADQPVKFIRDDKMYILRNGVIYDATGKRVIEINK